jgi:hypothetical protein
MSVATIQPPAPAPSSSLETTPNAFNSNLPLGRADKYRGASVEVRLLSYGIMKNVGVLTSGLRRRIYNFRLHFVCLRCSSLQRP